MPQKFKHRKNEDFNSFGGTDIIIDVLNKYKIPQFIDSYAGERAPRAEYTNGEISITWLIAQFRGARRIEDVYDCRDDLKKHPRFKKGMSPDTILLAWKQLAIPNEYFPKTNISDKLRKKIDNGKAFDSHELNRIDWFINLLIDIALKLGRLQKGIPYILDCDTTDIQNKIADSRRWFKGNGRKAYCPIVAMINNIPIYIENRNGDSNASFNLTPTIDRVLNLLKQKGIIIELVRVDAVGYNKDFTNYINHCKLKFVTRANSKAVNREKELIRNWKATIINKECCQVGDNTFYFGDVETRIIVKKKINSQNQIEYWGIITNDFDTPNEEMLKIYAKRGEAEKLFSSLKEFGWDILPMRKFHHNTVYLYVTALNYILFRFITKLFSSKISWIKGNIHLKTFMKLLKKATSWDGDVLELSERASGYAVLFGFT